MNRLASDGVRDGVMQRTHGKPGYAYNGISDEESGYESEGLETGNPVFISDEDYDVAVEALTEETAEYNTEDTAIVFMSYGTEHVSNAVYERLQKRLHAAGYRNYFIGTVEGSPTVEDVLNEVQGSCAKRVVLLPLMIVADDCAGKIWPVMRSSPGRQFFSMPDTKWSAFRRVQENTRASESCRFPVPGQ